MFILVFCKLFDVDFGVLQTKLLSDHYFDYEKIVEYLIKMYMKMALKSMKY